MANSITDARNSFITFNDELYLTQRECAIVKPFCLPIFEASDLCFQFVLNSDLTYEYLEDYLKIRTVSLTNVKTLVTSTAISIVEISTGVYLFVIGLNDSNLLNPYDIGECFSIEILITNDDGGTVYSKISNQCLQRIPDICFTSRITYTNNENAFGFFYFINEEVFINKIRLPIYFKNPQPQNDQKVYVRSDGTRKKLYARLSKKWLGLVDMTTEEVHQKLVVALSHDNITFVTDNLYSLECTFEDEYNQDFPDVMQGINVWTSNFSVMETPFDEVNNNCG